LLKGPAAAQQVEPQLGKGMIPVNAKSYRLELEKTSEAVRFAGRFVDFLLQLRKVNFESLLLRRLILRGEIGRKE